MLFERIVCGVDGSPASLEALRQAAIIRPPDGRLVAVIVSDAFVHAEAETSREAALLEIGDVPLAEAQIVEGRPIPSLLAIAGREGASLLAVGTHGGSRVAGILLGSVATAMLHDAPCPVLIARPAREDSWYPRSIVVGADGSPQSLQAAKTASALADRFGASLRPLAAEGGGPLDIEGLGTIDALEWDRRQPVSALVYASKQADLVICGAHGLTGVRALGSVSERVAHRAHCSVLVMRPLTRYANGSRAAQAQSRTWRETVSTRNEGARWRPVVGVDGSESARQAGALRAGGGAHTQRTPLSGFRVGHPAAILVEEIANADLLVGSRGLGGFRGLLLRSVSQQCAEHAGCVILRAESARHMTDSVER